MTTYFLRIVTDYCSPDVEETIVSFLTGFHFTSELCIEAIKPYWKQPEQGVLACSFRSARPIEEIQALLADHWDGDNADARRGHILVPHSTFLWLTM